MWFDIIKETESERLRRLGYDVPEEMDMAPTITRQMIIDKIVDWVNNQEEISPFEEYFEIAEIGGRYGRGIDDIPHRSPSSTQPAAHTKNLLVVEPTTKNTRFFTRETMKTRYDEEMNQYIKVFRDNMDDTKVAKFFVGVYPINKRQPIGGKVVGRTQINDMDFDVSDIIPPFEFPTLRAGGFFNNAIAMADGKLDYKGRGWIVGNSGNKYIIDYRSGDCNVILKKKLVEFIDFPELNTTLDTIKLCIHSGPELRNLPLGDKYAATIMGLKNDTALTGNNLRIVQLIAKPWKFKIDGLTENGIKRITSRNEYSLTEDSAAMYLSSYWNEEEGYFDHWFV